MSDLVVKLSTALCMTALVLSIECVWFHIKWRRKYREFDWPTFAWALGLALLGIVGFLILFGVI